MQGKDCTKSQKADSPFEVILRSHSLLDGFFSQKDGAILLLCGPPGAGKTTLGMYILHNIFHMRKGKEQSAPNALVLSLVETLNQFHKICHLYNFDFGDDDQARVHLVGGRLAPGDQPDLKDIASKIDLTLKPYDFLLIDGISVLESHKNHRSQLLAFLDQIKSQKLFTILIAEEYHENQDIFLQYEVDGVIRLGVDKLTYARTLEICKLRWHNHYLGKHAFRLQDSVTKSQQAGVLFFPSVDCLIGERKAKPAVAKNDGKLLETSKKKRFSSGVEGFDEIANAKEGPFHPGEQVLLIGPGGAGKFLFGMQFLEASAPDEKSILLSFVQTFQDVESWFHLRSQKNQSKRICKCLHFSPVGLVIEEMLGALYNLLEDSGPTPTRLLIDGISALRCLFESDGKFETFLVSVLDLLRTFPNVASVISYYTPRMFASYAEINIPAAERFSMVIGFNFQEQHNRLVPGIVILKSHVPDCDKSLRVPKVSFDGGYSIDFRAGWPRVGLLGGEREQVREERPFVKLFFENRSEHEVIESAFEDFAERYPKEHIFKMVTKHNPQPEHWSFLGYAGPGHSNTKLVELRKYVMDVLRERGVFLDIPEEMEKRLQDRFESGFLWHDSTALHKNSDVVVPFYADVGVLVYQEDALRKLQQKKDEEKLDVPLCWDEIIKMGTEFQPDRESGIRHLFVIPETVGDPKHFVSFFFELCWSAGWDFPASCRLDNHEEVLERLKSWVKGPYFENAISILREMTTETRGEAVPNPNEGGHYHESVFSRRWFSKIHLLPDDATQRANARKKAFRFGIAPIPGVRKNDKILQGISNVDLYCIGIIREALAPETGWMLMSSLLGKDVDVERVKRKRGLPISHRLFKTRLMQDNLKAPLPAPTTDRLDFYDNQITLFKKYSEVLKSILLPKPNQPARFRRTSDIPKFFYVEQCLADNLPELFKVPPINDKEVRRKIVECLDKIYGFHH